MGAPLSVMVLHAEVTLGQWSRVGTVRPEIAPGMSSSPGNNGVVSNAMLVLACCAKYCCAADTCNSEMHVFIVDFFIVCMPVVTCWMCYSRNLGLKCKCLNARA